MRKKGPLLGSRRGVVGALSLTFALAACDGSMGGDDVGSDEARAGTPEAPTSLPAPEVAANPSRQALAPAMLDQIRQSGSADVLVLIDDSAQQNLRAAQIALLGGFSDDDGLARELDNTKNRVLARLATQRLLPMARYRRLPFLHVRIDSPEALEALAADPDVLAVTPNLTYQLSQVASPPVPAAVPSYLALINQPQAAAAGKLGAGTAVAVLDTGTDYKRAPFGCTQPGGACKVAFAADFAPEDNTLDDELGHGTNVAGIVLAVAPAAKILALDVFSADEASASNILAAINWTIENRAKYNIAAMNMSFGGGAFTGACAWDLMALAIDRARAVGVLSAVASGNEGMTNRLASPACAPAAVSVGAVYSANVGGLRSDTCTDLTSAADKVACFSNAAPFLTMLAPGVFINAAGISMTGTSQATPHVAGAIAVLRAAFPAESPTALVTRMTKAGVVVKDGRNNLSKPRLDLAAALAAPTVAAPAVTVAPPATPPAPPPPAPPAPPPLPVATGTIVLAAGAPFTKSASISVAVPTTSGVATQVCLSTEGVCTAWVKWAPVVTFTLPRPDGSKTVRAWWKNAAGAITADPKTAVITLDRAAPVGGKVALSLARTAMYYAWSSARDTLSGIASYKLVGSMTGPPPASCSAGTVISNGPGHVASQAVVKGKTHHFRLCAIDKAGNASAGIVGQFNVR